MIPALLLAAAAHAAVRQVPPLTALARSMPRTTDARIEAFVARAAVLGPASAGPVSDAPAGPVLVTALAQALQGLDAQAIAEMPEGELAAIAGKVWDAASAADRPGDATVAPRYGKVHVALEFYLKERGFAKALDAMEFARGYHAGKRKDGITPEFQHQLEIALFLTTLKDTPGLETVLTVALLHDVVEDYDITREEIAARFGAEVEDGVWRLTKVYQGKHKEYPEYFAAIAESPVASLVKGADRVHNLQSMVGVFRLEKQREYADEAEKWFLPMLKTARRRFPAHTAAYFNIEHMIKSQLRLIRSFLEAAGASEPRDAFKALETRLGAEVNAEKRYVFANRERVPESVFIELVEALRSAGVAVLDTTFGLKGLKDANVGGLDFEEAARRLESQEGPLLFHVDHHYPDPRFDAASTTPMVVDLLRHLLATGRRGLVERLQSAWAILDHTDTDISLAHLALRKALEPGFLEKHGDLLKEAALFNDYVKPASTEAKSLFAVAASVEDRLANGTMKFSLAFDLLEAAARGASSPELDRLRAEHEADYRREIARLGSVERLGEVLVVRDVSTASALRHFQESAPDKLSGVRLIVAANEKGGRRYFKLRSVPGADGAFMDLAPVYALLNAMTGPKGKPYKSSGRASAGGVSKDGFEGLDDAGARAVVKDIVSAARLARLMKLGPLSAADRSVLTHASVVAVAAGLKPVTHIPARNATPAVVDALRSLPGIDAVLEHGELAVFDRSLGRERVLETLRSGDTERLGTLFGYPASSVAAAAKGGKAGSYVWIAVPGLAGEVTWGDGAVRGEDSVEAERRVRAVLEAFAGLLR